MIEGTNGRDTDGAGSPGIVEEQNRAAQAGETASTRLGQSEGADTDGPGSPGIVEEQTGSGGRPALAFEHAGGHDTDGAGSGGILDEAPVDFADEPPGEGRGPSTALPADKNGDVSS